MSEFPVEPFDNNSFLLAKLSGEPEIEPLENGGYALTLKADAAAMFKAADIDVGVVPMEGDKVQFFINPQDGLTDKLINFVALMNTPKSAVDPVRSERTYEIRLEREKQNLRTDLTRERETLGLPAAPTTSVPSR